MVKMHPKSRSIQQKYRKTIEHEKEMKKHTIEVVTVIFVVSILYILLNQTNFLDERSSFIMSASENTWFVPTYEIDEALKSVYDEYHGMTVNYHPELTTFILKISYEPTLIPEDRLVEITNVANELLIKLSSFPTDKPYIVAITGENDEQLASKMFGSNEDS
ncbi:hypothetical protein [Jeotgalibacillus sp. R-1-5s-1]|uniref:hypothetical protein n=1 Tax=Jeotgalibacillus sp. R-1-5s-1 TaxID=2555897 RepID=UPI00106B25BD|nr:hypothetical protein [Jeotgalibacillus sp. R-1-5s-1]TFD93630.1 hypothetical protein E2491_14410 [Jeotgalibacillus sp. R-1-5s-1]